jgi:5'-deoxynucleotidase
LPASLREYFEPLLVSEKADPVYKEIVKAADIICAYIKALDELRFRNTEFEHVKTNLELKLRAYESLPEVKYFIDYFLGSCVSTLDDLTRNSPLGG